jgi:hypothetical protein
MSTIILPAYRIADSRIWAIDGSGYEIVYIPVNALGKLSWPFLVDALIVYSYIRVLPDGFLLKAIVFTVWEHDWIYQYALPPPPIIASSYGPVNSFCYFMYIDYLGFEIQLKPELWKPIINLLRGEDTSYRDSSYAYGIQKSLIFGNSIHLYRQIYI